MISNPKVVKVSCIFENYNLYIGSLSIGGHLKHLNFKKMKWRLSFPLQVYAKSKSLKLENFIT
jgi:hypothetical protein